MCNTRVPSLLAAPYLRITSGERFCCCCCWCCRYRGYYYYHCNLKARLGSIVLWWSFDGEDTARSEEGGREMGSLLGDWPSYDPHNFSQLRPADPSAQPSVCVSLSQTHAPQHTPPPRFLVSIHTVASFPSVILFLSPYRTASELLFLPRFVGSDHPVVIPNS